MTKGRRRGAGSRANALPETVLVLSLVLTVLFGIVEMALIAFFQISADGAAFMGAQKSVALEGVSASLASAQQIATGVFTHVHASEISVATPGPTSTSSAVFETDVTKSAPNIGLPSFPRSLPIQARTVEPGVASSTSQGPINFCSKTSGGTAAFSIANTVNAATGVTPLVNDATGAINTSTLTSHVTDLTNLKIGLTAVQTSLISLSSTLTTIASLPIVGTLVSGVLNSILSLVQPVLNSALAGTATTSQISSLGTSLNTLLSPIVTLLGHLGQSGLASTLTGAVSGLTSGLSTLNLSESDLDQITGAIC
jgi:TadE-like protein